METHYTWKTRFFRNTYEIYQYDNLVGEIHNKTFSRTSTGELNGKKYIFDIKGFFHQETRILNENDGSVIAEVEISAWKSKSSFRYNNRQYSWQHDNFWNTKWSIRNETGDVVKYHSSASGGEITAYTSDELIIIAGLFIKNYFRQRAAAASAST